MNDFWEWMEKKRYGERKFVDGKEKCLLYFLLFQNPRSPFTSRSLQHTSSITPTKQMLIGYMMEYLREKEGKIILNTGGRATINDVYDRYVKDIEKVEQENLLERMAKGQTE